MSKERSFDKLGYIISLITSSRFDASVTSLSQICDIPIAQMRQTLATIADNSLVGELMDFDDCDYPDTFKEAVLSGEHDDEIIVIELTHPNDIWLPVTAQEKGYLKAKYPNLVEKDAAYDVKDIVPPAAEDVESSYDGIKDALLEYKIKFTYKGKDVPREVVECTPVSLIQDLSTNRFYFADTQDNMYRLDRMENIKYKYSTPADLTGCEPNPNQPYTWGAIIDRDAKPIHVKIQIADDIGENTRSKLKRDLEWRQKEPYVEEGVTYYEDDVIDLGNFHSWLRKYGSSITVLEPQELIDKIVDEAKTLKAAYEELDDEEKRKKIMEML